MSSFVHRLTNVKTVPLEPPSDSALGGPVTGVVATLSLPAGDYIVSAKAVLRLLLEGGPTLDFGDPVECQVRLVVGGHEDETTRVLVRTAPDEHGPFSREHDDPQEIHLVVGARLTATADAQLVCHLERRHPVTFAGVVIIADQVQNLTITEAEGDPPPILDRG